MFPHYFGLDFSAALPWLLMGFIAGLIFALLWRLIAGNSVKAKAEARVRAAEALMASSDAEHQERISRLESDSRNYEMALAESERRASRVPELSREAQRLAQLELQSRNDLLAQDAHNERLRKDLERTQARLYSDVSTLNSTAEIKDSEIARLVGQVQWHEARYKSLTDERQGFSSELGAAKAAQEMKDAEITRLIAQLQANTARTAGMEQDQRELARLKSELGNLQMSHANIQSEVASRAQSLSTMQASYADATKDLDYMRNLAYWQTSEIDRLRKAVTQHEGTAADTAQTLAKLRKQHDAMKTRLGRRGSSGLGQQRLAHFRRLGANGNHADGAGDQRPAPSRRRQQDARRKSLYRAKAYKLGKLLAAANRGQDAEPLAFAINRFASRRIGFAEIASLKARIAELSEDADSYRRLREAVHAANRIAGEGN